MKSTAWENLFRKYYNEALLYVFSFCHNRALAEDLVQEAYMRAIRSIDEEKDSFKFWLFKVCRNLYFDTLRKNKKVEAITSDMPSNESLVDDVIQKDEYRALYKAISLLKDDFREIVRLYYFDSMSVKEIASIVDESVDNVKIKLYRARLKLKDIMEAYIRNLETH